ncbi:MAG: hypothetical protein A3K83_07895 [Omnitrophica WOR_2 bacterium RBG_13_44_8b]|nr:MAG: hypothetical protein A3K83_07895 [Omnitrophica WOR_2 bacterium RBG_13_44_8b]
MKKIDWDRMHKFNTHWIKIKFFNYKPDINNAKVLKNVRFCEATKEVAFQAVLLDNESISCPGARYAFGWDIQNKHKLLARCYDKQNIQKNTLKSILSQAPYFKKPPRFIGLNTEGEPDLVMSYMSAEKIVNLMQTYHNISGKNLDISLCSMMSICGGVAVRSYLEKDISISFGCYDSRKFADMRRENLAVGIPKKFFEIFFD